MKLYISIFACLLSFHYSSAQDLSGKANKFIELLDTAQRSKAVYPFDTEERYRYNFVPLDDRKGIEMNALNAAQQEAVMDLLSTSLSDETVKKIKAIRQLDNVLKELEHRKPEDHYRDPNKYFITIFGIPSSNTIWGWRFEGHHIAFHFSSDKKQLVAGTPSFLGANPAIVLEGPKKNEEVLKDETNLGFALLNGLSSDELKKALIATDAPKEIITGNNRKALIEETAGIRFSELTSANQQRMLKLVNLYVHRYTKLFANSMLKEIETAGLNNLRFAWAGATEHVLGKPYYYRIQGPTIIIEYDNTQNNANHIHTVIRDLKNDFGGDLLLQHYKESH